MCLLHPRYWFCLLDFGKHINKMKRYDMIHCCSVACSQWCKPVGEECIAFGRALKEEDPRLISVAAFVDLHNSFKEQTSKGPQKWC